MSSELAEKIEQPIAGVTGLKRTKIDKAVLKTESGRH